MEIITTIETTRAKITAWKKAGLSVGLVPTMGYLHEGHGNLIDHSTAENDRTVVSIFVNPTQFAPGEDLTTYPRDLEKDMAFCLKRKTDLIFHPEPEEIYHPGYQTVVEVPLLASHLCGISRPTHFRGVCGVVLKLFNIITPDRAYFGLKDAQQYFILRRMVLDLDLNLTLVPCPIIREPDGLALSSRNVHLSKEDRLAATILKKSLSIAQQLLESGEKNSTIIRQNMKNLLDFEPRCHLDYLEIVDTQTLTQIAEVKGEILVALAAFFGKTRLIDNFIFVGD
ncbi:MAG: pantoate--beta-alanine ligase [Deltaproteobacteria bacterium]|jgi:pantoate--beta-alanine ligase|nr:pantoate--beta-alanine ligase [Deltaproteobacteria bacterium]